MLRRILSAAALLVLAACAGTQSADNAPAGRDCFRADDVFGYNVVDDHNVKLRANGHDYMLTTSWNAHDLNWNEHIGIRATPSGWICTGNGLGVEVFGGQPPRLFPVNAITRIPDPAPSTGS